MRISLKSAVAGVTTLAVAGVLSVAGASTASAAYPVQDAQEHVAGSVMFYDAAGNRVYSGDGTVAEDPKYFLSTGTITATSSNKKALVAGYTPQPGQAAGLWPGMGLGTNKDYPLVGAPASVSGTPANSPATFRNAADRAFKDLVLSYTAPGKPGDPDYTNLYEIRVRDFESVEYSSTYITIDPVSYAWAQVDPAPPVDDRVATTTTLSVTPASPSPAPADLTLTANVAPTTAPGSVEFFNGTTSLGTVTPNNGVATLSLLDVPEGSYNYMARFTPTDMNAFMASNSNKEDYTVSAQPAQNTTTTLTSDKATAQEGESFTFTAAVNPVAPGTIEFFNGATSMGAPVATDASGVATKTTTLPIGSHTITAQFVPTDSTKFNGSTSQPVSVTVTARTTPAACDVPASECEDPQNFKVTVPEGSIIISTPYGPNNPFDLGIMAMNPDATELTTGPKSFKGQDPDGKGVTITDSRQIDSPWTANLVSSEFSFGANNIPATNLGFTEVTPSYIVGNAQQAVTTYDNPANSVSAPNAGLASPAKKFADTAVGRGTVYIDGNFTLNAPTSTPAGVYTGIVTFTITT